MAKILLPRYPIEITSMSYPGGDKFHFNKDGGVVVTQ